MHLFRKLFFLSFFLFFTHTVYAQTGSIEGTITDRETNEALSGVNVGIENTTKGGATNTDGVFKISEITPGNYTLVISAVGYAQKKVMVLVNASQTTTANVDLAKTFTELQEVEIIGRSEQSYETDVSYASTKVATRLKDVPQAISYVSKELIADKQAYRVNDVVENISGINQFSYYNDFTIRGFRSQQELINGKRVINLFGPQTLLANLERVEIIKGPASAVFGNASPGGTMNRVTKKPLADDRKAISFSTGSFNTLRSTLDFTGPLNENKTMLYRLNVAYENSDSFRDLQQFKSLMIAPSISFLPTDKTRLNFDLVVTQYDGR